jgi:regulator of protease activity HflC (stomatin/prohibitin superfamily)
MRTELKIGAIVSLIILLLIVLLNSYSVVQNGEVGIKTTWGKASNIPIHPGLYFYVPIGVKIVKLDTKVRTISQTSEAASRDLQNVDTKITLNYHLGALDPVNHFTRLGNDIEGLERNIVKPATSEVFKAIVSKYNAEELITKRDIVSNDITKALTSKLSQYDLFVDSMSITNFSFSKGYSEAIEAKQIAEQHANKAKNDLIRISIEAQQKVVEAKGQADAMLLQKAVITPELIELKQIEIQSKMVDKWSGNLPVTYMGSNNPMMMLNIK